MKFSYPVSERVKLCYISITEGCTTEWPSMTPLLQWSDDVQPFLLRPCDTTRKSAQCSLHSAQCSLHSAQWTVHTEQCTLNTLHYGPSWLHCLLITTPVHYRQNQILLSKDTTEPCSSDNNITLFRIYWALAAVLRNIWHYMVFIKPSREGCLYRSARDSVCCSM